MSLEDDEARRKRLVYRSWHRGTREMDLLLGPFSDRHAPLMTPEDVAAFEELLLHDDADLYEAIMTRKIISRHERLLEQIRRHHNI